MMRGDADGAEMDQEPGRGVRVPVSLMRMALALLDRAGADAAAARLRSAISAVGVESSHAPGLHDEHGTRARIVPLLQSSGEEG